MRWQMGRRSENVEDRRGRPTRRVVAGGGGLGIVLLALVALYLGVDPTIVLQEADRAGWNDSTAPGVDPNDPHQAEQRDFVAAILGDTEDAWNGIFRSLGRSYSEPTLVLFSGAVESACGHAQAAVGPFYCPADRKVYIYLSFYDDLRNRHGAPGDFAQAYVIAHEIGHHVQTLLGISPPVHAAMQRSDRNAANQLSVRLELQADCLAGIWAFNARRARDLLEDGDVEEGLAAASAIGDDRLQWQARGYVAPESFTHGTSEQRVRWFERGLRSGDLDACDTFAAERP